MITEMEPKFVAEKSHSKRDCNVLSSESVVSSNHGSNAVRVKIVLTKRQLRQLIASIGDGHRSQALEQLLHALRKRHAKKSENRSKWRPALQSIPEEF